MPIRPVDYQIMVSRAAEISRITNNETQKENSLQKNIRDAMKNQAERNLKQVYDKEQAYEAVIRHKQEKPKDRHKKRDNGNKGKGSKNSKRINGEQKDHERQQKTTTIDIKI
jgi:hypothetical protein